MKKIIKKVLLYIVILVSSVLIFSPLWIREIFGDVTLDEIIFHLIVPLEGSDVTSYVLDGIKCILIPSLVVSTIMYAILQYKYKYILEVGIKARNKQFTVVPPRHIKLVVYILFLVLSLMFCLIKLDIIEYAKANLSSSTFIEDNYVDPKDVDIKFPENKRNLIYIIMESMESSYASSNVGGILDKNLIPNLANIANENTSFSNTQTLGGARVNVGATWTIASMVSHFSGVPLKISIEGSTYGRYKTFLPGITNFGDILQKEGYNQLFVLGSDITFGGRDNYMKQHGNYDIFDYNYAAKNDYYNEEYVWWGYDDEHLYEYAKEQLISLASKEEPFNMTLLTVDTHFEDGYLSECCTDLKYDDKYSNVISCADNMVFEFIEWIKQQDFYGNTTIVIVGDHLTMDVDFFENYKESEKDRRVYNAYINPAVQTDNMKNREFSTMDFFPTTLASLGVSIEGDRLGLGTNLFSNNETLIEKYGFEYVNDELGKKSKYYNNKFLFNK